MFSDTLRILREYHGVKKAELARRVGCTQNYINGIERDMRPPTRDVVAKIAAALELSKKDEIKLTLSSIEGRIDPEDLEYLQKHRFCNCKPKDAGSASVHKYDDENDVVGEVAATPKNFSSLENRIRVKHSV